VVSGHVVLGYLSCCLRNHLCFLYLGVFVTPLVAEVGHGRLLTTWSHAMLILVSCSSSSTVVAEVGHGRAVMIWSHGMLSSVACITSSAVVAEVCHGHVEVCCGRALWPVSDTWSHELQWYRPLRLAGTGGNGPGCVPLVFQNLSALCPE